MGSRSMKAYIQALSVENLGSFAWFLLLGVSCYGCTNNSSSDSDISGVQLIERLQSGWSPTIIDVRSGVEYNTGHVPDAVHVSFWSPLFSGDALDADKAQPVVVYCEHGPRAYIAAYGLRNSGFKQVYYLEGHMSQWRKDGLPIEKPSEE